MALCDVILTVTILFLNGNTQKIDLFTDQQKGKALIHYINHKQYLSEPNNEYSDIKINKLEIVKPFKCSG